MTGPSATVQVELATPVGPARAHVDRLRGARGVLVLGHGAGPSITTVDLTAAVAVARSGGWAVALVEQPWLVAGRRVAPRPAVLDQAWLAVVPALVGRGGVLARVPGPLVVAGRSAGARVACRTATTVGADGVLALSFPLHAPGKPQASRAGELALPVAAHLPVEIVQGDRDPFGTPDEIRTAATESSVSVHVVPGGHAIPKGSAAAVEQAVGEALRRLRDGIRE